MRGRKVFMDSLVAHGVERIFGNPGTTESPLLDSLIEYPTLSYVVALQESIALCAAGYYAQASGKTGVVNLHVAPGLGNAIGMLHGAWRANTPMIVTAGQQDTRLRLRDPVLGHDLVAMAEPLVKWSVQVERADEMAPVLRRAFKVAHEAPSGPVFVGLPIDVMEQETQAKAETAGALYAASRPDPAGVAALARLLLQAKSPVIVAGDDVAQGRAHAELVRLAEATGAGVWWELLRLQLSFPTTHANARGSLPVDAAAIRKALEGADLVLMVGGPFFEEVWYAPGSPFPAGAKVAQIERSPQRAAYNFALDVGIVGDLEATLREIVATIAREAGPEQRTAAERRNAGLAQLKARDQEAYKARAQKAWDRSPISVPRVMAELRAGIPREAVVVEESITASTDFGRVFEFAAPGDYYGARGGGIGQGIAGALGVKVAHPDRPVVCISGDGSAMYAIQALWTAAHHGLAITFVILANREYRILKHNIDVYRARFGISSQHPYAHMDLGGPQLGFVEMAAGMGVSGTRVTKAEDVKAAVANGITSGKPHLIEIAIEGKR